MHFCDKRRQPPSHQPSRRTRRKQKHPTFYTSKKTQKSPLASQPCRNTKPCSAHPQKRLHPQPGRIKAQPRELLGSYPGETPHARPRDFRRISRANSRASPGGPRVARRFLLLLPAWFGGADRPASSRCRPPVAAVAAAANKARKQD